MGIYFLRGRSDQRKISCVDLASGQYGFDVCAPTDDLRSCEEGVQVILVLDGAGRHGSDGLKIPESMTLYFLPPYSSELMPMERV